MGPEARIAVIILTYNEALHIARALDCVSPFASQVFVIDSGSTDRTAEIARKRGATVLSHPWTNHAQQFQWALDNAPITSEWIMRLDADEVIEPDLAQEIIERLPGLEPGVTGINLKRKHIFLGRWIRHGGRYPLVLLRIWRHGKARIEQRWMDEHMLLLEGRSVTFEGGFADHNLNDLSYFTDKHNNYATREAVEIINERRQLFPRDASSNDDRLPAPARMTRLLKEQLYGRLNYEFAAAAYFILRYVFQLGFLDGREGAIYHFLQGFWYRFLVGAKVLELERELGELQHNAALIRLSELTGLQLLSPASPSPREVADTCDMAQ